MSRRHHGRPHHARHRIDAPRPDSRVDLRAPAPGPGAPEASPTPAPVDGLVDGPVARVDEPVVAAEPIEVLEQPRSAPEARAVDGPRAGPGHPAAANGNGGDRGNGCTAPQLRRFIKSRPYVPMHELRRRFGIDGGDDDVTRVPLDGGEVFVGLPDREGTLLGELLRGGEVGYELSFDPRAPIVVGVYPMRPVPRG